MTLTITIIIIIIINVQPHEAKQELFCSFLLYTFQQLQNLHIILRNELFYMFLLSIGIVCYLYVTAIS